jgi:predicted SAM-dependent methyltransferase
LDNAELLAEHLGIRLDLGCGANKQPGFVGMDLRALPGVDLVHNWNDYPWPLPDGVCHLVLASHVVEHVNPADGGFLRWMDEVWRIMKLDGELAISVPHGYSMGYLQDPTHCNQVNEATWSYFDPRHPFWTIYRPKPWRIKVLTWDPTRNIEVVMVKIAEVDDEES